MGNIISLTERGSLLSQVERLHRKQIQNANKTREDKQRLQWETKFEYNNVCQRIKEEARKGRNHLVWKLKSEETLSKLRKDGIFVVKDCYRSFYHFFWRLDGKSLVVEEIPLRQYNCTRQTALAWNVNEQGLVDNRQAFFIEYAKSGKDAPRDILEWFHAKETFFLDTSHWTLIDVEASDSDDEECGETTFTLLPGDREIQVFVVNQPVFCPEINE